MQYVSYSLLRKIVKARELSLAEVAKSLPKKFGDHRDFYPLATLYTSGYVDCTIHGENNDPDFQKNLYMAALFYTACLGPGQQHYMMFHFSNTEDFKDGEKVFATAKADLYFQEQKQKRLDRIVTLLSSVAVGVLSAWLTLWVKASFGP